MNKFIIGISIFCLFGTLSVQAQKTYTLSLKQSVELAKTENRTILNANYDRKIAKKKVWETTAIGLPQVKTELKYQNMLDVPVSLLPAKIFNPMAGPDDYMAVQFGQQHSASFNFTASQLIFSGEYIVALQASKTYQELSLKAALKSETNVIELVTKSYYGVLLAYENEKILLSTREDIKSTYEEIKKTHEVGMVDEITVSQLELNLINIDNSIASIKRQKKVAENILKFQIGIDVNDSIIITDSLESVFANANFQSLMAQKFDVNKNIDYQLLQTQKHASELSLKREKSTFLPTLSAFYAHSVSGQTNNFDDYFSGDQNYYQSNIIGAGLSWNIFSSGSKYVKVQQAQLEYAKLRNQDYMLQQSLQFQVHQAKTSLINAYESYLKEKKNKELAGKIYQQTLIKFKNGLATSTELTQLNVQFFTSQSAYYRSIMQVLNAQAELDKILGNNLNK